MVPQVSLYHFYNILAIFLAVWFCHKKNITIQSHARESFALTQSWKYWLPPSSHFVPMMSLQRLLWVTSSEEDSNTTHSCHTDAYRASGSLDKAMSMVPAEMCVERESKLLYLSRA